MTGRERSKWYLLTALRALLSLLDLVGILAIGFVLTSVAVFVTSGSDPSRTLRFAGLDLQAVNVSTLPWVATSVLAVFLTKALLSVILMRRAAFFVATVEARAAKAIAEATFGGDLGDVRKNSREEIMYAIQAGSPSAFNSLLNAANSFATEAMLFIVICLGFLFVDPFSTLVAILYFGLVAFVIQFFLGSLMARAGEVSAKGSIAANTAVSDLLSVFRELLVIGKRAKFIEQIYEARSAAANSAATQFYLRGMPRYIIEAALLIGVTLFVLFQLLSGDVVKSAATIGVFLSGGFRLTAALLPLQNSLLAIKSTIPSARTAHIILEKVVQSGASQPAKIFAASVNTIDSGRESYDSAIGLEFEAVSYTYPNSEHPAIHDVSFTIEPGSQVALMGPSGAGKSTIADLLCNVIRPTEGRIIRKTFESSDVNENVIGRVSYVPQRPGLVSGTILENVALAEDLENLDRPRAMEAIYLSHLGQLVESLPEGIDTPLGKLQDGLSGGQMQRLGLARALYTKPNLLVMDEATSALDAESEAEIQKALTGMRGAVTVVLIAHRLNTIQNADLVILVEEGQVKDSGTFKELIARNKSVERVVELMMVERD